MAPLDLRPLLPLLVLSGTVVLALLTLAWRRGHGLVAGLTAAGLVLAGLSLWPALEAQGPVTPLWVLDGYTAFYLGLIFAAALAVTLMSPGYLARRRVAHPEEYYVLLLLATLGAGLLVGATHFAALFLGLETLSVSLYGLIAYVRRERRGVEAGFKYLVLAATASALLLFGMALWYARFGDLGLSALADRLASGEVEGLVAWSGLALMVAGLSFKLALVPFHLWTPEVYQGAPAPVTAYLATVSKGAVLALLLRHFGELGAAGASGLFTALVVVAIASMWVGNLLALLHDNLERLLAYSSIAHMGYVLVAWLAGGVRGVEAATFYLAAYVVTMLLAFGVVTGLSGSDGEAEDLASYRGLFWRRPYAALLLTVALLSLAGIPLTAGFIAKFGVLEAGVGGSRWALVVSLIVTSVIGLFYYARVLLVMLRREPSGAPQEPPALAPRLGLGAAVVLAAAGTALLWLGVYPTALVGLVHELVAVAG